jgi:hypothetical protein
MLQRMIRVSLALLALLAAAAPVAAAERRYSVTDFERIVIEGPYIVRLSVGRSTTAIGTGSQAALDRTAVDVQGRTLRIRRNRTNWSGNSTSGGQDGPLTIDVTTGSLRSARVIGPGRLDIDRAEGLRVDLIVEGSGRLTATNVDADNLQIGLAGAGTIELAGAAESVIADIQGTGNVEASRLRVENATITTGTTGEVGLQVVRAATINAFGLGTVSVTGGAACTLRGPSADLGRCDSERR